MPPPPPRRLPIWTPATAAGLAGSLTVSAITGVAATYRPVEAALVALVYLGIALSLTVGARWLAARGTPGRWLGAAGLALVALWQVREVTAVPEPYALLLGLVGVATLALRPVVTALARESRGVRDLGWAVVLGSATVALLVGLYRESPTLRWHLLRHNTMVGTPLYYALDPGVAERRQSLFAEHGAAGQLEVGTDLRATRTEEPFAQAPPNLVLILLDTLRADALSGWGGAPDQMPRLDARLERAFRFTDVWASATWTRPSMATFFTGLQPEAHGARTIDDGLAVEHRTLAEVLSNRGYSTTAIVTNWAAVGAEVGFDQGYDTFEELRGEPYARAETVARAVDSWVASSAGVEARSRPVFLYLHLLDPHEPYLAGVEPRWRTTEELQRAYRSELAYLDRELDRIIERLTPALDGPTRWVVLSDHGEELYEHELFGHGFSLYEEVLSIPAAVWGSGITPGASDARLEGRDIHSLLLTLASPDAIDLAAWSERHTREQRYASIYYSSEGRLLLRPYLRQVAMRARQEGDRKWIWSAYGDTWELYDLAEDPRETENLLPDGSVPTARTDELDAEVESWRPGTPLTVSDEALEQLRGLGYVD